MGAADESITKTDVTLAVEQRTVLSRTLSAGTPSVDVDQLPGSYVLRRNGQAFLCPVDMQLRSWLSLTSLVESLGAAPVNVFFPPSVLATADEDFMRWRRDHPQAVPHIRQATWGVPRTWFTMVAEDERETYTVGATESVRYRARVHDARRRLASAHSVLSKTLDEDELLEELVDLSRWVASFDEASWVEVDYAGVAQLLGAGLRADRSAMDIHRALDALRKGDVAAAASAYQEFEHRWRVVNAYERAN